jgi:hypothetical protein
MSHRCAALHHAGFKARAARQGGSWLTRHEGLVCAAMAGDVGLLEAVCLHVKSLLNSYIANIELS